MDLWYSSAGDRLYVRVVGDGPVVVWSHGGLGTHAQVLNLVDPLEGCTRITPDARGRGASVCRDPLKHSFDQYADDVVALLDRLGCERAVLGGNSMGSGVSCGVALRHPDRVAGLVLAQCGMRGNVGDGIPDVEPPFTREEIDAMSRDVLRREVRRTFVNFLGHLGPARVEIVVETMLERHDPGSLIAQICRQPRRPFETITDLAAITAPVLLVASSNDALHPAEVAEAYAKVIPDVRWANVEGPADDGLPTPGRWLEVVGDFVKECSSLSP